MCQHVSKSAIVCASVPSYTLVGFVNLGLPRLPPLMYPTGYPIVKLSDMGLARVMNDNKQYVKFSKEGLLPGMRRRCGPSHIRIDGSEFVQLFELVVFPRVTFSLNF